MGILDADFRLRRLLPMAAVARASSMLAASALLLGLMAGCATAVKEAAVPVALQDKPASLRSIDVVTRLNRITWGVNDSTVRQVEKSGFDRYLEQQLHPGVGLLPAPVQAQIDRMTIVQRPLESLIRELEQRRKDADAIANDDEKKAAQQAYQQELNRLAREAATRSLLRDVYSPHQLQEQMTWFWMNHFNVHQGKHNARAMMGD